MRAIGALTAAIVVYFLALELAIAFLIPHVSNSAKRELADFAAVTAPRPADRPPQVLLIGNSLLLHGVDRKILQTEIASSYETAFLPVENTSFFDWYYGLRRLFAENAKPSVVVLSINIRQLMSDSTNGEGFARRMMQRRDLVRVRKASHLDNTATSAYFFATFSEWLGSRSGFRNWLLEQWLPGAGELVLHFASGRPAPEVSPEAVTAVAAPRLAMLSELCESYGARFVYVLPATTNLSERAAALTSAADALNVRVLVPYAPGEMPGTMFGDGFHLSPDGAKSFTQRLAPLLKDAVASGDQRLRRTVLGEKAGG